MSEPASPKRRGRPSTGKALSPAQRMALVRERARQAALGVTDPDLSTLSDTGLFEILQHAYRQGLSYAASEVVIELFARMEPRVSGQVITRPKFEHVKRHESETVTESEDATVTESDVREAVESQSDKNETVTEKEIATVAINSDPALRDRRIMEIDQRELAKGHRLPSQREMVQLLHAEGIKCSSRTVGAVRITRNSDGK